MIFIYNETTLPITLKSELTENNTAKLFMMTENSEPKQILCASNEDVVKSLHNRYQYGRLLKYNPAREYVLVKDSRLLIDPIKNEYVVSNKSDESETDTNVDKKKLVKNTIILVLAKKSTYHIYRDKVKKSLTIDNFGPNGDYKIVILHISTFNWSAFKGKGSILINGIKPIELQLVCSEEEKRNNTSEPYKQNIIKVVDYKGEFPTFKKVNKPNYSKGKSYFKGEPYSKSKRVNTNTKPNKSHGNNGLNKANAVRSRNRRTK